MAQPETCTVATDFSAAGPEPRALRTSAPWPLLFHAAEAVRMSSVLAVERAAKANKSGCHPYSSAPDVSNQRFSEEERAFMAR